jgi:hypothetical protein
MYTNTRSLFFATLMTAVTACGEDFAAPTDGFLVDDSTDSTADSDLGEQDQEENFKSDLDQVAPESHCVLREDEAQAVCFPSFSEAIAFSTGEILDRDFLAADYPLSITTETHTTASQVVALGYENKSYSGSTLQFVANSGCSFVSQIKYFPSLPAGWDNRLSSYDVLDGTGCDNMWLYENTNYGGAKLQIGSASPDVGILDNAVSSARVQW